MKEFILKYKYWIFAAIVVIHFFFKFYRCGDAGLWFDEGFTVQLAQKPVSEIIRISMEEDPNPPLYGVIAHYWINAFGDSEEGLRSLSVFASSLAAGVLFLLCLNFFNWQTSVFASLMYFTSNDLYYYGLEGRTYALLVLFILCSYYLFLSILNKPTFIKAVLFAIVNACIFYSHFLACFVIIGEVILFPFLAFRGKAGGESEDLSVTLTIKRKVVIYLGITAVVFTFFLWPWKDRTIFLLLEGGKAMWLAKPTFADFKQVIYDFFNTKTLYQVHIYSALAFVVVLLFFKRFREDHFNWKMLLLAFVIGPGLMYLNYFAAGFTPIFLKRYILYTFLGFILIYSYLFSLLRFPFFVKAGLFCILSVFSFLKITYPREAIYDYNKAVPYLKELQKNKTTLIINDMQDLMAYYYDKDIFHIDNYHNKHVELFKHDVYTPYSQTWVKDEDFSFYKDIYYTRTFDGYYDPTGQLVKALNEKYKNAGDINGFKGIKITHYINPNYKPR